MERKEQTEDSREAGRPCSSWNRKHRCLDEEDEESGAEGLSARFGI
jgi:hypothetical protein